ncbi:MAG: hypothetical protein KBA61_01025 [Spirochaetes bacterium]|nr:hypothetical protein [Spirochaetota bacterium]
MEQIDKEQSSDSDFLLNNAFITGVSGRLGDSVFYTRNGKIRSRRHVIPSNPRTRKQQAGRSRFAGAVRAWRMLDEVARADWKRRAARHRRTGYNLFIAEYLAGAGDATRYSEIPMETERPKRRTVRRVRSVVAMLPGGYGSFDKGRSFSQIAPILVYVDYSRECAESTHWTGPGI